MGELNYIVSGLINYTDLKRLGVALDLLERSGIIQKNGNSYSWIGASDGEDDLVMIDDATIFLPSIYCDWEFIKLIPDVVSGSDESDIKYACMDEDVEIAHVVGGVLKVHLTGEEDIINYFTSTMPSFAEEGYNLAEDLWDAIIFWMDADDEV